MSDKQLEEYKTGILQAIENTEKRIQQLTQARSSKKVDPLISVSLYNYYCSCSIGFCYSMFGNKIGYNN